jgi:hypothetical protein
MRRAFIVGMLALAAIPARSEDPDFRFIAHRIESEYHTNRARIPLFGAARFMARPFGVHGLDLAIWKDLSYGRTRGGERLTQLVADASARGWKPILRAHSPGDGEVVQIFAKPHGRHMRLLVLTVEDDTVMVYVKVDPDRLSRLLNEHSSLPVRVTN